MCPCQKNVLILEKGLLQSIGYFKFDFFFKFIILHGKAFEDFCNDFRKTANKFFLNFLLICSWKIWKYDLNIFLDNFLPVSEYIERDWKSTRLNSSHVSIS